MNNCTDLVELDLELLEENIKNNFKFIAYSVDIRMLSVTEIEDIQHLKWVTHFLNIKKLFLQE